MKTAIFFFCLLILGGCIQTAYDRPYIISHIPEEISIEEEIR